MKGRKATHFGPRCFISGISVLPERRSGTGSGARPFSSWLERQDRGRRRERQKRQVGRREEGGRKSVSRELSRNARASRTGVRRETVIFDHSQRLLGKPKGVIPDVVTRDEAWDMEEARVRTRFSARSRQVRLEWRRRRRSREKGLIGHTNDRPPDEGDPVSLHDGHGGKRGERG